MILDRVNHFDNNVAFIFDFLNEIDLIINGTSLGMINQQKLDIDISNAKKAGPLRRYNF